MMQTVSLSDICTKITSGGTPLTKRDDYYDGGIPWLRTQEVNFGNIYSTEKTITELGLKNSSAKIIPKDSVIVAMYGATAGKSAINKIPLATNQACCNLIIDNNKADYRFVYYYLVNSYKKLLSAAVGAAQQNLGSKQISAMTINLPSLSQQKKIANILGSLDEKIELNRRMNETLEQLGQALFRHCFVDNPAAKNWKRGVISDLGEVVTGKTPSKKNQKFFGDEVAFLKVPDMHKTSIVIKTSDNLSLIGAESQKAKYIPKWSTCVSCIATVGVVSLAGKNMQTNQQINSIVPRKPCFKFFNYFLMRHKSDYIKTLASSGSATPNLNMGHFSNITVVIPDRELLKDFDTRVSHLFLQMENNLQENEILINIRDSLLPKLISGEIEV